MRELIFSFDIGYSFHGWAVNRTMDGEYGTFAGVLTFDNNKDMFDNSNNEIKREKRRRKREKQRRKKVMDILIKTNVVTNRLEFFERIKKEKIAHRFWEILQKSHYEKITPFEFGNILYRFAKNRYYIDMRKRRTKENDSGVIKSSIKEIERFKSEEETYFEAFFKKREELAKNLEEANIRIPFRNRQKTIEKIKKFFSQKEIEINLDYYFVMSNKQMASSIKEIARRQRSFGNDHPLFEEETINRWYELVTFKGTLPNIEDKIGFCISRNGKKRCAKNSIDAELFRIADTYNNLYLSGDIDCHIKDMGITQEEFKNIILGINKEKITVKDFLKALQKRGYIDKDMTIFLKRDRKSPSKEDATLLWTSMHKLVSDLNEEISKKIFEDISFREKLEKIMLTEIDANEAQKKIEELFKKHSLLYSEEELEKIVDFDTGKPTVCSSEAYREILPLIKEGKTFKEAIEKKYGISIEGEVYDRKYLSYKIYKQEQKEQNINNPFLDNIVYNFIWIFNKMVQKFGTPDRIVFETTREILSLKEKEKVERLQKLKEMENEKIKKLLEKFFKDTKPNKMSFKRVKLFLEQGGKIDWKSFCQKKSATCIYTGKPISLEEVLDEEIIEIDHIIPRSTGYIDNSLNNFVLFFKSDNKEKLSRTPMQYLMETKNIDKKEARKILVQRMKSMNISLRKMDYILTESNASEIKYKMENDFLMDNRKKGIQNQAAKFIMDLISRQYCFNDKSLTLSQRQARILPVKGKVTSYFRRMWLKEYKKNRNEYVNHAVDAMVMLNLDRSTIQRLQTMFNEKSKYDGSGNKVLEIISKEFTPKIENFQKEAYSIIEKFDKEELLVYYQEIRKNPYKRILEQTVYGEIKDKGSVAICKRGIDRKKLIYYKSAFKGFERVEVYEAMNKRGKKHFICKIVKPVMTISSIEKEKEFREYQSVKLKEIFYRNTPIEIVGKNRIEKGVVIGGVEGQNKIEIKLFNRKTEKQKQIGIKTSIDIKKIKLTPFGTIKREKNKKNTNLFSQQKKENNEVEKHIPIRYEETESGIGKQSCFDL